MACSPANLNPTDARVRRLTVTIAGRRVAEQTVSIVEAADAAFFAAAPNYAQFLRGLRHLDGASNLSSGAPAARPAPEES